MMIAAANVTRWMSFHLYHLPKAAMSACWDLPAIIRFIEMSSHSVYTTIRLKKKVVLSCSKCPGCCNPDWEVLHRFYASSRTLHLHPDLGMQRGSVVSMPYRLCPSYWAECLLLIPACVLALIREDSNPIPQDSNNPWLVTDCWLRFRQDS